MTDPFGLLRALTGKIEVAAKLRGTAFFVAPNLILTCAHVVAKPVVDNQPVHFVWNEQRVEAVPVKLVPPFERGSIVPTQVPMPDLAFLKVELEVEVALMLSMIEPIPGSNLYTFGYPEGQSNGDSSLFVYEGPGGRLEDSPLKLRSAQAKRGASGSPVLDASQGRIVGMLKQTRSPTSAEGARAISARSIFKHAVVDLQSAGQESYTPDDTGLETVRAWVFKAISVYQLAVKLEHLGSGVQAPLHLALWLEGNRLQLEGLARKSLARMEAYDPQFAQLVTEMTEETFPAYLSGEEAWLKALLEPDRCYLDDEEIQAERRRMREVFLTAWSALEKAIHLSPFVDASQSLTSYQQPWRHIGFASEKEYNEMLFPSMDSFKPSDIDLWLLRKLLKGSIPVDGAGLGMSSANFAQLTNRLYQSSWIKIDGSKLKLTVPGKEILESKLSEVEELGRWR